MNKKDEDKMIEIVDEQNLMRISEKLAGNIAKEEFHKGAIFGIKLTVSTCPFEHPLNESPLNEWDIIGMNHFYVQGCRHLFVAMTKGKRFIKAEGPNDKIVFEILLQQIEEIENE